jgi:3-oxo-5-alpha-steroid 4-dehydrogenase 1
MAEETFWTALLAAWTVLAVAAFAALLLRTAPYGRFARPGWGPAVPPRPAWLLMESPAAVFFTLLFCIGTDKGRVSVAFLLLWNAHYVYRGLAYPWLKRSARGVPISIVAAAICFHAVNCYLQARYLFSLSPAYPAGWLADVRFLVGAALFGVGLAITVQSDMLLRSLRTRGQEQYQIPHGGLFRWVSCPNYLGELIEWSAWAVLTWSLPGLVFGLWTAANLVPRAVASHRWYRRRFPDYPPDRKAVLPFVL